MTPEQAFQKWWSYTPNYSAKEGAEKAFHAGIQYKELHQIGVLADIRKAIGDPTGKLMQDQLLERVKQLVEKAER